MKLKKMNNKKLINIDGKKIYIERRFKKPTAKEEEKIVDALVELLKEGANANEKNSNYQ